MGKVYHDNPEKYPEVKEWLEAVTEKPTTRISYTRAMSRFIEFTGLTPKEMLEIKRQGLKEGQIKTELEGKIVEFIRALQSKDKEKSKGKYAPMSILVFKTAIGSFLNYHGYQLPRKFMRLGKVLLKRIRVPRLEEVEAMIQYASNIEVKALLTVAAECPCRPRVFAAMRWDWLETGWQTKDVALIQLPQEFRPSESGARKFEPVAFIGRRGIEILKQLAEKRGMEGRVFSYTRHWFGEMPIKVYNRAVRERAIRASAEDEQPITLKSFRKYMFNAIDAARDISPEWRDMLKGRALGVEEYYSEPRLENLKEIYRAKVYPEIWRREKISEDEARKRQILDQVKLLNPDKYDEVVKILGRTADIDEAIEKIRKKRLLRAATNGGKPFESRIVGENELTAYLDEGWDLVKELSNGRIVVRRKLE